MSIPTQLPQFVTAARPGALQALALQAGQVLDARIVGPAPNGGTQVEIRGQVLNLVLPTLVKAGETIRLEVQGTGPQLRLALQTTASPPPAAQAQSVPATQISLTTSPAAPPPSQPAAAPRAPGVVPSGPAAPPAPQAAAPAQATATVQPAATARPTGPTPPVSAQPVPVAQTSAPQGTPAPQPAITVPPPAVPTTTSQPAVPPPAGPYPAAVTPPNPFAAAAAATATTPAQPAVPAAVAGAVRPVVATSVATNATAHSPPGNAPPQAAPPQPATPQSALAQMVQVSVPRQGSIMALTTALTGLAGRVVLPEPVARAAQQVLAGRVAIDAPRFDGNALQTAVRGSGVFQEANLARGQALLQPDMKSALLTLRQTLTSWIGQQAPVAPVAQIPPPLRGSIPRARGHEPPPQLDPAAAPEEIGRQLLERTESALARVRLHQHASLPDPAGRTADLSLDLPVMVGTHQTLMQLQIHRDQHNEADTSAERGWQVRFALSLPDMGEVGAQVTLRAGAIGVMLWATEPGASAALDAEIGALREALSSAGLQPGAVLVRHGAPPTPQAAPSGHFVDSRT